MEMSGRVVNDAPFQGFDIGEVLYLGSQGHYRDGDGWNLSDRFKYSPNYVENEPAGRDQIALWNASGVQQPDISVPKYGHEYYDFLYAEFPETSGGIKLMILRPIAVYVESFFRLDSFSQIGY